MPRRAIRSSAILFVVLLPFLLLGAGCAPRLQQAGPFVGAPVQPHLTDTAFVTDDGVSLPLRRWLPEGRPHAVILALHGFNDYSNAFEGVGSYLAGHGVAVYAWDQRGFGRSPQTGIWPGTRRLTDDARGMAALLRARWPDVPLYALGESMGGGVLMAAEDEAPLAVDGFVLAAPAVWGRATMPAYQTAALWLTAHTLPWMTLTGRGLGIVPSDNIEMLRALSRDPLVLKETRVDAIWGIVNLMDAALAAAPDFDAPALFLYGERDEIVPPDATLRMFDSLPPHGPYTIAVYKNGYHMLLRDLEAHTVWRDVLSWIDDRAKPLPSGADRVDFDKALAER